jgi:hypothetical protein
MPTALYGSTLIGDGLFGGIAESLSGHEQGISIFDRSVGLRQRTRSIGLSVPGGKTLRNHSRSIGLKIPDRDL